MDKCRHMLWKQFFLSNENIFVSNHWTHGHMHFFSHQIFLSQIIGHMDTGLPCHPVTSSTTRVRLGQSMLDNKFFINSNLDTWTHADTCFGKSFSYLIIYFSLKSLDTWTHADTCFRKSFSYPIKIFFSQIIGHMQTHVSACVHVSIDLKQKYFYWIKKISKAYVCMCPCVQ